MEAVLSVVAWWVLSFIMVALVPMLRAARVAVMVWQAVALCGVVGATDAPTLDDIMHAMEADAARVEQPVARKARGGAPRKQRAPRIISERELDSPHLAAVFAEYLATGRARALRRRFDRLWARGDYATAEVALRDLWALMEARAGGGVEFAAWGRNRATVGYRWRG